MQFVTIQPTISSPNDNFQYSYAHSYAPLHIFIFKSVLQCNQSKHVLQSETSSQPIKSQGPVVQSIVSLMSSLRGQLVKCFMTL